MENQKITVFFLGTLTISMAMFQFSTAMFNYQMVSKMWMTFGVPRVPLLVGGFNPSEKYDSQLG